jgi:3',5'-cyclic AMP phosphodiesterase CpdA
VAGVQVVVVSDTHLSPRTPEAEGNWQSVVDYVAQARPRLVIHTGDLTRDGPNAPDELRHARRLLEDLPVPWLAIPGNHDVGDNPGSSAGSPRISDECVSRWVVGVGPDHWQADAGPWTLLGINAQLFGSGLDAENEQWEWLGEQLSRLSSTRPAALFCHKPITASRAELAAAPSYRFVPEAARRRLSDLLADRSVPLVVSGHVHQYRLLHDGARRHVWAPTTWAVLPEDTQPTLGVKRCGVVSLTLPDDGAADIELVEPPGLRQLTLTRDIPDPYDD